ncbi:hypothetical protein DH2020_031656 [Rehmannia glutinosa]|uniref:Reverse transcriptase zinc-binding domain n=1 Tax=Rehmannia glutinosa TaxID=99300 RepID=A0ABR0VHD7_REHGL
MRAKYYPLGNFWNANIGSRPSWSWRSIFESREVVLMGARKLIRSGRRTNIWHDPWLPRPPDFMVHSHRPTSTDITQVSELIDSHNSCWKEELVHSIFCSTEASLIFSIPIGDCQFDDLWCWHFSRNGKFTVKSVYHLAASSATLFPHLQLAATSNSSPNPIWKAIWKICAPPRFKFFIWRCVSAAIPTIEFLARHHIISSEPCSFCSKADCDSMHIFLHCHFSRSVWRLSGLIEHISDFVQPSFSFWIREVLLHSPPRLCSLFVVICTLLWFYRNRKKFDNITPEPFSIVAAANSILEDFDRVEGRPEIPSPLLDSPLFSRPTACYRIFFDGAVSPQASCAGLGVALLNPSGNFIKGLSKKISGIFTPEIVEFYALREALIFANRNRVSNFSIFGDAATVILAANEESSAPSAALGILDDIHHLKSSISPLGIFWLRRDSNYVAHRLAFYAKNMLENDHSWDYLPDPLCQSLLDDFQHT